MISCLLKKALPFALTFVIGATVGGLFKSRRTDAPKWAWTENAAPMMSHGGRFGEGHGCRAYRRNLLAESKPLVILFKPDARAPRAFEGYRNSVWVRVTFGSDGKVQGVEQLQPSLPGSMLEAVERAAQQIQFEPATANSVAITVTKDIEIHFMAD
jgi:hypothetical protein